MSKKISAVILVVLIALALPASAAIWATNAEIRGAVASESPSGLGQLNTSVGDVTWDHNNFAGFYYDLKDNLGTENLQITGSLGSSGSHVRTIGMNQLTYSTAGQNKTLMVYANGFNRGLEKFGAGDMASAPGSYLIVGWQGEPYVGIKNHAYKLAKLIIEQGNATAEKKTLVVGESWDVGGGWAVTVNDAGVNPRDVWLTLSKNGVRKDDAVIRQGRVYTYVEKSIGGESDVPLFVTYVDSIFLGANNAMVQLRYTWAVDTSILEIKGGDVYGVFKVQSTSPIQLNNSETTVTLSKDTTVDIMGGMKFKVADSDTVRFYPMKLYAAHGTYEVRGTVASESPDSTQQLDTSDTGNATRWTPNNFAGFYYDLKDDMGAESLQITPGALANGHHARTIGMNQLTYSTTGQNKTLMVYANGFSTGLEKFGAGDMAPAPGSYLIVGWQAEPYVGIKNRVYKLAKLIIEQGNATAEKKTLVVGETWDVGGGWAVRASSIDSKASPRQVELTLSKDGVKKDDAVVTPGKVYTYVEKSIDEEFDVPLFVTYVDSIFAGATTDMVQLRYTWAVDTSILEIKGGDVYGVFKVQSTSPIQLNNSETTVTLSKDTTVDIMGGMKFKVADNDTVRFYPEIDYVVPAAGVISGMEPTPIMKPEVIPTATPEVNVAATPTVIATATAAITAAPTPTETLIPTETPEEPGFEAFYAIAGLLAVAYLVLRLRK